ncbi:MAG: hypothetical protein IJ646_03375 [Clostridia bacterium]|nr:hypothetical protein [Clostridia bacterium]
MKKLTAMICAIVMVMALAVPALAAGSPSTQVTGAVTVDATTFPAIANVAAPAGSILVTDWVAVAADTEANADGTVTLTIPALANLASLAGYQLQIVLPDGTVQILDLTNVPVAADGTISIEIPAGAAFRVIQL